MEEEEEEEGVRFLEKQHRQPRTGGKMCTSRC